MLTSLKDKSLAYKQYFLKPAKPGRGYSFVVTTTKGVVQCEQRRIIDVLHTISSGTTRQRKKLK